MTAFGETAPRLTSLGVSCIPIHPGKKFPGVYSAKKWGHMRKWDRYCDRLPFENEIDAWSQWPDAGIGVALGTASNLAVIDVDVPDGSDQYNAVLDAIPPSPVAKTGEKGLSLFYRHNPAVPSRSIRIEGKVVVELLCHGRQTVIPPTIHPDTQKPYRWIGKALSDVQIADLPMLPGEIASCLEAALEAFFPEYSHDAPSLNGVTAHDWRDLNEKALHNLHSWIPDLIPDARQERDGYRCVAYWRGGDGWNVGIHKSGIRDWARGIGMTALDLIVAVNSCDIASARTWLEDRLAVADMPSLSMIEGFLQNPLCSAPIRQAPDAASSPPPREAAPPEDLHPWERQLTGIPEAREWREPLPYLVDGMIPCGRMGVVSGAPGSLKSMLLMHMGCCVAGAFPWVAKKVSSGPVLWYNADSPTDAIQDRLGALANGLNMVGTEEFHLLSFPQPSLDLSSKSHVQSAIRFILKRGIRLFFIDALQRVKGGANENDATEMAKVMDGAREIVEKTGCTLLFIHHLTKEQNGKAGQYRGSSAILDAIDFALTVEREGDTVNLKATKERESPIASTTFKFSFEHFPNTKKLMKASFDNGDPAVGIKTAYESLKDRVLDFIRSKPEPGPTLIQIRDEVRGKASSITTAIEELLKGGQIRKIKGEKTKVTYAVCSHVPDMFPDVPGSREHMFPNYPPPSKGGGYGEHVPWEHGNRDFENLREHDD